MSTHNICFRGEIRKILCGYPLLSVAMLIVKSFLWSFSASADSRRAIVSHLQNYVQKVLVNCLED